MIDQNGDVLVAHVGTSTTPSTLIRIRPDGGINDINCPDGYVTVPSDSATGVDNDFCIMKFEAKNDGFGNPTSVAETPPWTNISQPDAKNACLSLNDLNGEINKYDLVSNPEWMATARNVEQVASNWTSGIVGTGCMFKGNVGELFPCNGVNTGHNGLDPDYAFNPFSDVRGDKGTASLDLSTGEEIWDLSGNVTEWVDWTLGGENVSDVSVGDKPFDLNDGGPLDNYIEINNLNSFSALVTQNAIFPDDPNLDSSNGIGKIYVGNRDTAPRRGGRWNHKENAGIYGILWNHPGISTLPSTGFRCVYRP